MLIQEKAADDVQQAMQEVRALVVRNLPQIAQVFADKAAKSEIASVPHARFLLDLFDWRTPAAAEKKAKTASTDSGQAAGEDSTYSSLMETLEQMVKEAEARAAAKAGAVK
jgi:hypothetical protein